MKLEEFLSNIPKDEIMNRLILLDKSIKELHANNFYVVSDMTDIEIINNEVTLASFKNKVDYLKQPDGDGFNPNGDKQDILEMCAIGICAFNSFSHFYSNGEFIKYLIENIDMYLENGAIPREMRNYYVDVFMRGNVNYLNDFLLKSNEKDGTSKNNSKVYTKSTEIGKAFSERNDDGYTKILLLPAIVCLVFLIVIVVYFIFYR